MSSILNLWSALVDEIVTHPVHVLVEFAFVLIILYFWRQPMRRAKDPKEERPTPAEVEELIAAFSSQPLEADYKDAELEEMKKPMVEVSSYDGVYAIIGGSKKTINLATFDFLGFATNDKVRDVAERAICEFGVGSCGPRGFYGSLKPHLDLETDLAKFMGTHSAIIYSFSFATSSTLIPCFSARGDEILVDERVSLPVQQGCMLSRSHVTVFRHNDMAHLEELMALSQAKGRKSGKLPRRFVVTEGIFRNDGSIATLDQICKLKQQYKFRLILDDCFGFGVLGATGRGTPEHFGIPQSEVDIYVSAMSASLGSIGGFCVGSNQVVDHQRLAATGYVFSASLPPYSSAAASKAVALLTENPSVVKELQRNAAAFRSTIRRQKLTEKVTVVNGDRDQASPLVHFCSNDVAMLHRAAEYLLEEGYLVPVVTYNAEHKYPGVVPALRVAVKAALAVSDVEKAALAVTKALNDAARC